MRRAVASVIRWEDPPPSKSTGRVSRWRAVAAELRAHPGEWALIDDAVSNTSTTNHINHGKIIDFRPPGAFEATQRKVDGRHLTYARFVGDPS